MKTEGPRLPGPRYHSFKVLRHRLPHHCDFRGFWFKEYILKLFWESRFVEHGRDIAGGMKQTWFQVPGRHWENMGKRDALPALCSATYWLSYLVTVHVCAASLRQHREDLSEHAGPGGLKLYTVGEDRYRPHAGNWTRRLDTSVTSGGLPRACR